MTGAGCLVAALLALSLARFALGGNSNRVFQPCADARVRRSDDFTLGFVISRYDAFFFNKTQLTPCDSRLHLSNDPSSRIAIFRPKVDEISLFSINSTRDQFVNNGGYMVAFAGHKYAARSLPIFIGNNTHIVLSFTVVLEFTKGTLQNLYWKSDCKSCSGAEYVCLNGRDCSIITSSCNQSGKHDCNRISIQVAFSGTDKDLISLNSWYEVSSLRRDSLSRLYSLVM